MLNLIALFSMFCNESDLNDYEVICPYCQKKTTPDLYGRCTNCACDISH